MDALTPFLNEMYLSGEVVARFDLTSPWGIRMPSKGGIFHAIDEGHCWVRLAPDGNLVEASAGDLIIFSKGDTHDIFDDPSSATMPLQEALCTQEDGSLVCPGGGGGTPHTSFICGVFHFRPGGRYEFSSLLPPMLHIRSPSATMTDWIRLTVDRLREETAMSAPGASTVVSRLTDILFIEGIRAWLNTQDGETAGWLGALTDPIISRALTLMHGDPGRHWSVEQLAAEVGLSRSAFYTRFTGLVGEPPLRWLTHWRMQLATNWLRGTEMGIGDIADGLGYSSEEAFKRAFKRELGVPPGSYRRAAASEHAG
jgi:AraC-like DNA-binding protein